MNPTNTRYSCIKCDKEAHTKYMNSDRGLEVHLKRFYNLTLNDYKNMKYNQDNKCALCNRPPIKNRLAVDHCHKTGIIRGLLCSSCNKVISYIEDVSYLNKAITYLQRGDT